MNEQLRAMLEGLTAEELVEVSRYVHDRFFATETEETIHDYDIYEGDDVTRCPRCNDVDIFPGQRVCSGCRAELYANEH